MSHQKPSPCILRKLSLDDPRWADLSAPWPGAAGKVPILLDALHSNPSFDFSGHSAWAELHDIIYHQGSCYESTYATVPYLVELGLDHPPDRSEELWISVGYIAANYRVDGEPIPRDLVPAFQAALRIAELRCLEVLLSEPWNGEESCYLALAAVALSGHPIGLLITTDLMLDDSVREATCPGCEANFVFSLQDAGIATYISDPPLADFPSSPTNLSLVEWLPFDASGTSKIRRGGVWLSSSRLPEPWTTTYRRSSSCNGARSSTPLRDSAGSAFAAATIDVSRASSAACSRSRGSRGGRAGS